MAITQKVNDYPNSYHENSNLLCKCYKSCLKRYCPCNFNIFFPVHDYNYQRAFYKDEVYRTPRMSSEYGLQSYPSLETLSPVYEKEDLFYEASLNNHRQRHGNGKY